MLKKFESNIIKNKLFTKSNRLIIAVSGGVDSVVLAHLLKNTGFMFCLAHCNFKLRGKESEADEKFCKQLATHLNVEFYTKSFDTKKYATKNKWSIQMAARNLRYDWFKKLLIETNSDFILTAHHANDTIETVFINLLRGTGINGLKGIAEKNKTLVRPLLPFTKKEIESYAVQEKLNFRLDKSNLEDKYERNFIRLHIVPILKKLNPEIEKTFIENVFRFSQEAAMLNDYLELKRGNLLTEKNGLIVIDKLKLANEKHLESVFHYILNPFGFNTTQQTNITQHLLSNGLIGKHFSSKTHQLTIDRKNILIKTFTKSEFKDITIHSISQFKKQKLFTVHTELKFSLPQKNELLLNQKQLIFPLKIRNKQTGDKFKPFGMNGFKLVSDFLKDQKMNAFEKENCKLLINGNGEIVWIIGYRSDERYKVNKTAKTIIKLTLLGEERNII